MPSVLRHADFRYLWLGQSASSIGYRITLVALALYVDDIGTPSDVGLVLAAQSLPLIVLLLFGGVWADRLPRQKLMIATDVARAGLHGLLALLILTGTVEIWHIVVIEGFYGAAEAFFRPAYTGLVPQTVPEEDLQAARAMGSLVESVSEFAGPALATVLVLGLGAGYAFAIDAATFLVSAIFLSFVRPRERGGVPAARQSVLTELREGWHEVRSRAWVWVVIASFSLGLLFAFAPFLTLGPAIAREVYDEPAVYGIVNATFGIGTIVGSLTALRWFPARPLYVGMLLVLAWPLAVGAFASGLALPILVPLILFSGAGLGLVGVWWETALAQRIPPGRLSRVSAWDWMGSLALMPLGYLLAGPLGETFGAVEVLTAGAALGFLAHAAALLEPQIRELTGAQNSATPSSGVEASA